MDAAIQCQCQDSGEKVRFTSRRVLFSRDCRAPPCYVLAISTTSFSLITLPSALTVCQPERVTSRPPWVMKSDKFREVGLLKVSVMSAREFVKPGPVGHATKLFRASFLNCWPDSSLRFAVLFAIRVKRTEQTSNYPNERLLKPAK